MRFFGNNIETVVCTDKLERCFLVQSPDFYEKGQYTEVLKCNSEKALKEIGFEEIKPELCYGLLIPEAVLEVVGYNL